MTKTRFDFCDTKQLTWPEIEKFVSRLEIAECFPDIIKVELLPSDGPDTIDKLIVSIIDPKTQQVISSNTQWILEGNTTEFDIDQTIRVAIDRALYGTSRYIVRYSEEPNPSKIFQPVYKVGM